MSPKRSLGITLPLLTHWSCVFLALTLGSGPWLNKVNTCFLLNITIFIDGKHRVKPNAHEYRYCCNSWTEDDILSADDLVISIARPSATRVWTNYDLNTMYLAEILKRSIHHAVHPMRYAQVSCFFLWLVCDLNFTLILQGYFTGTGAIIWLPQCQWSNSE